MNRDNSHDGRIKLFKTHEHPCSYLPGLTSQTIFIDPDASKNSGFYQSLLEMGFRRSGSDIYRPDCPGCEECISVRIPVERFSPRRSQRRVWKQLNNNLSVKVVPTSFEQEHFELYTRYINSRHPDGDMANPTEDDFRRFLICHWCDTIFVEFRSDNRLFSVAVIDLLPNGMSAVYTFFDPERSDLSPGVLAILWQINETKRLGLPWLYLGYWIPGCQKMQYKQDYRPLQLFRDGAWREFSVGEEITNP